MQKKTTTTDKKQELSDFSVSKSNSHDYSHGPYNPVKGEMALWSAVITQALMDAGSESSKPEAQHEKAKAIRWLLGNSEDFVTVCQNAGLDPQYIRSKAKAAIERGCVWRSGMTAKRSASATQPATGLQRKYHIPQAPKNQPRPLQRTRTSLPSNPAIPVYHPAFHSALQSKAC